MSNIKTIDMNLKKDDLEELVMDLNPDGDEIISTEETGGAEGSGGDDPDKK